MLVTSVLDRSTDGNELHFSNALWPMEVRPERKVMLARLVHALQIEALTLVRLVVERSSAVSPDS